MKQKMFQKKGYHVCNRLVEKMDRGFDIEQNKKDSNEAFLDDHPRGFKRKGSMMDYYHSVNSSI